MSEEEVEKRKPNPHCVDAQLRTAEELTQIRKPGPRLSVLGPLKLTPFGVDGVHRGVAFGSMSLGCGQSQSSEQLG